MIGYNEQKAIAERIISLGFFDKVAICVEQIENAGQLAPVYPKGGEVEYTGLADNVKSGCYIRPLDKINIPTKGCSATLGVMPCRIVFFALNSDLSHSAIVNAMSKTIKPTSITTIKRNLIKQEQPALLNKFPLMPKDLYFAIDFELRINLAECPPEECAKLNYLICAV